MIKRLLEIAAPMALLAILAVATLLVWIRLDYNHDTVFPAPTGEFAVGRTSAVLSEPSQTDPLAPEPTTQRELFVWIWYPATPSTQPAADYIPPAWRAAMERQRGVIKFLGRDLSRAHPHSVGDAPLSPRERSYPVVLMLGGLDFSILAEDLASHGYVVASPEAPYRSSLVVFPDGRVITRANQNNPEMFSDAEVEQLANKLVQQGSVDMTLTLDRLDQLDKFHGRLDLERVGAFGHSIRGATVLQFCHDDPRCKACIDIDGIPFGSVVREGLSRPVLFLMSDHAGEPNDAEAQTAQRNFGAVFARLAADRRPQLMIRGANHYQFSDDAVLRSPVLMRILRAVHIARIDGLRQVTLAAHYIGAFFDIQLKGAPASRLNPQPDHAEVSFVP